jgi:ATP-dependent Clp protease, protease subunit
MASTFDDHLANQLLGQRSIFLGTEIDDVSAQRVCSQLLILSAEDPRSDIRLYINSSGGVATAGLAVHDVLRLIPNDVATVATGQVAGMGQVLLSAGAPGKRYALPSARIMLRQTETAQDGSPLSAQEAVDRGLVDAIVESLADLRRASNPGRRVGL